MMRINGLGEFYSVRSANGSGKTTSQVQQTGADLHAAADKIELSEDAVRTTQLKDLRKKVQDTQQPVSSDRIEELKKKYAGDACPVSDKEIAQALWNSLFGGTQDDE